jgi:cytochrome b involved in lipid metabolism
VRPAISFLTTFTHLSFMEQGSLWRYLSVMAQISVLSSVFDTIGGLPVHPLAVHLAVVLVPLGALALIALIFLPRQRKTYLPITVGTLAVGAIATYMAKESGEQLANRVGLPQEHAALGDVLFPASIGLLLLAVVFWWLVRTDRPKLQLQLAMSAVVIGAIAVSTLTFFVGHSGAEATWANKIQVVEPTASPTESQTDASTSGITLEELAKHNTTGDCWTAVEGKVVDLTDYLSKHPGGSAVLSRICGTDGTNAFLGQHSGQQTPMAQLDALVIGTLSDAQPSATPSESQTGNGVAAAALTVTEIAKHNTSSDCWSVVSGNVYDLTGYANSHPGGASAISSLCGKDATQAFQGQHSGQQRPESTLAAFLLGPLEGAAASTLPGATVTGGEENENEEEYEEDED